MRTSRQPPKPANAAASRQKQQSAGKPATAATAQRGAFATTAGEGPAALADELFASLFSRHAPAAQPRRTTAKQQRIHADLFVRDEGGA